MEKFISATHYSLISKEVWPWTYFSPKEMACRKTGAIIISVNFMNMLQELRVKCGFPLIVTSGYRTSEHNMEVSNTGPKGPHTTGKAADIAVSHYKAFVALKYALDIGFTGIGINQKGDKRFLHLDILTKKDGFPRPTVWSY